jgi:hypothetical protein
VAAVALHLPVRLKLGVGWRDMRGNFIFYIKQFGFQLVPSSRSGTRLCSIGFLNTIGTYFTYNSAKLHLGSTLRNDLGWIYSWDKKIKPNHLKGLITVYPACVTTGRGKSNHKAVELYGGYAKYIFSIFWGGFPRRIGLPLFGFMIGLLTTTYIIRLSFNYQLSRI